MAEFSEGDVVRLKSGGPAMTVSSYGDDGFGEMKVFCTWFDDKGVEKGGAYKPGMLEKIEPDRGGGGRGGGGPNSWMT